MHVRNLLERVIVMLIVRINDIHSANVAQDNDVTECVHAG